MRNRPINKSHWWCWDPHSLFRLPLHLKKYSAIHFRKNHWRTHQQKQKHLYKTFRCHDHLISKSPPAMHPDLHPQILLLQLFLNHPKIKEIEVPKFRTYRKKEKNQTTIPTWGRRLPCILGTGRKGFCSDTKPKRHLEFPPGKQKRHWSSAKFQKD